MIAAIFLVPTRAPAAGPHPAYELQWDRPGERLTYRSCGCADACWIAEVRRGKQTRARLRCDCEALYFHRHGEPERLIAGSCSAFNAEGKLNLIQRRMNELTGADAAQPNAER